MRIAFDTAPLHRPYPPGVVRACRGLVSALRELDGVELIELAPEPGENERAWRHLRLPDQIRRAEVLGLHSPISAFPFRGPGRRVCTVHELPWRNGCRENAGVGHRFWARFAVGRGDGVVCPTEHVRRQLIEEAGGGRHIRALPWGLALPQGDLATPPTGALAHLGLEGLSYGVVVGGNRPKKNLRRCLRALAQFTAHSPAPLHLVVTGEETEDLRRSLQLAGDLGLRDRLHAPGHLAEDTLAAVVGGARFTCVVSQSEGFGFPVLESMALGVPVIVSKGSAQEEVAGGHGIGVENSGDEELAAAMEHASRLDASGRTELKQHAARFTWQRCAEGVRDLWGNWA